MVNNLEVALTKEICPVCLKECDGDLVINQILTHTKAEEVKKLHGKVIGIKDEPCKDCIDQLNGVDGIYLIGMDPEKTTGNGFQDIYRTGNVIALKKEAFERIFEGHSIIEFGLKHGFAFVDYRILEEYIN